MREFATLERSTAATAARRELMLIREALESAHPESALAGALLLHTAWLHRLTGCSPIILARYAAYRRELVLRFGVMRDADQLEDATQCVLQIVRGGMVHHEA